MIPKDTVAAARAALQQLYDDRADVYRVALTGNVVEQRRVYPALPCHLSLDSKPVLQQGEQVATAPAEFTVYFPPDADICEGDRLTITHMPIASTASADAKGGGLYERFHLFSKF